MSMLLFKAGQGRFRMQENDKYKEGEGIRLKGSGIFVLPSGKYRMCQYLPLN